MNKIDTLIIDKTGTITEGKPSLKAFQSFGNHADDEILQIAASIDANSEHPIADAIVSGAKEKAIEILNVENFESVTGKGVKATLNGKNIGLGNHRLVEAFNAEITEDQRKQVQEWQQTGQTVHRR